jgi:hypothetical protein
VEVLVNRGGQVLTLALMQRFLYGVCMCIVLPATLLAQVPTRRDSVSQEPLLVPKTASGITVDAVLDEAAWQEALLIELNYEVRPGENVPPPVSTEVLLTYDADNLYAAFRCHDPEPSAIRAHLRDRDTLGGDDWVALILDTFNDQRRSFDFIVTAQGVQFDEIEAQSGEDPGWDAIWASASRITSWGYAVEMAIPFSSLRFQRTGGSQVWGFDAVRRYPRDHPYHIGTFPRDRSNNCYLCQSIKIQGFEDVSPGRNIELDPTVIAFRTDSRPDFPEGELEKEDQKAEVGFTAGWGITPNMTFNFTANPDFSQVEADARQLDINEPFALFFPERRPFFTEGADFFAALENVIYTRTIREPSWGVKLTGKEGANTVGTYVMRDDITNLVFPGPQGSSATTMDTANTTAVFRYKRDFGSRYTAGLLGTVREGPGYHNRVFGADLDFRFTPTNQIQLLVLRSSTEYPADIQGSFDQPSGSNGDHLISFEYDHYTRTWGWWADYEEAGDNFRADLGYYPRVGYRNIEGGVLHTWNGRPGSWWSTIRAGADYSYFGERDGGLLERSGTLWLNYQGTMQSFLGLEAWQARYAYAGEEYDLTGGFIQAGFWPASDLQIGVSVIVTDEIDYANARLGSRVRITPWMSYNLGRHFRLALNHNFERMSANDARLYTANISQLTAVYQFNVRMFFRAILQYVNYDYNPDNYTFEQDSEDRRLFSQLLFSYKLNPRTVLFLGYVDNHRGNQDFSITQSDRTFFVKLGYAWTI